MTANDHSAEVPNPIGGPGMRYSALLCSSDYVGRCWDWECDFDETKSSSHWLGGAKLWFLWLLWIIGGKQCEIKMHAIFYVLLGVHPQDGCCCCSYCLF